MDDTGGIKYTDKELKRTSFANMFPKYYMYDTTARFSNVEPNLLIWLIIYLRMIV